MRKNLTELVFILDCSGSMQGLEADTIGGFNSMLKKQQSQPGEAYLSTVLFDSRVEVLHDRVPVQKVRPITTNEYYVRGCTALLDAVGSTIQRISSVHRHTRPKDRPEHTMFVITTDGMENASRFYSASRVKKMIRHQQHAYGWEFLFLGANIDAVETAGGLGIAPDRAVNYRHDSAGTRLNYEVVSEAVCAVRCSQPLSPQWKAPIEQDFRHRKL